MQYARSGALILLFSLILSNTATAETNHTHQLHVETNTTHHHHSDGKLRLNKGDKWPTDTPLRQGMKNIRIATDKAMQSAHASPDHNLSQQQADKLAEQIDLQVNNMFAQCKLPPDADAVLHTLLADMLQAARQLKAPGISDNHAMQQSRIHALLNIQNSLELYPKYFYDNEWPVK